MGARSRLATVLKTLAAASARVGARVLLLEADLRRPTIARQLGITAGRGVADVLIGSVPFTEALHTIQLVAPTTEKPDGHSFDVLVAGATPPPNPGELIESKAMESLWREGAGAPLLGVIANGFKSVRRGGYGYGYGYDYTPAKADPPSDTPASPNGTPAAEAPPVASAGG